MTAFKYEALRVMRPFHASTARHRLVVGGYGSGKSHGVCAEAIALGLQHPGLEVLVMRKTVPALKKTTERIFLSLLPPEFLAECVQKRAGGHLESLQFPNGSLFWFQGCDDWKKHRSLNLGLIVFDEADEFTSEDYDGLQSRLRQSEPTAEAQALGHTKVTYNGNLLASNPWGHNWVWEYFVDVGGQRHKRDSSYFTSTSFDNPYLPRETLQEWLDMPDPWVRRFVLCSFDEFAGAIYPEWSYDTHVVPPLKGPDGKYRYDAAGSFFRMGYDPGSGTVNAQTGAVTGSLNAAVWCYYDPKTHRLIAVAEYGEGNAAVRKHAMAWRRIEATHGMRVQVRIADPGSVNNRDRGSNMKLADLYRREGFPFQIGPNKVADRVWTLGELIASGRFVVTTECPRLYEQILSYRFEDLTPSQIEKGRELKPLKKDVDLVDAAQYAVSRYVPPPPVEPKPVPEEDAHAQEVHAAIQKQIKRKRGRNARSGSPSGNVPV
jgi:PBSX family phage terminase large subunit